MSMTSAKVVVDACTGDTSLHLWSDDPIWISQGLSSPGREWTAVGLFSVGDLYTIKHAIDDYLEKVQ